MAANGDDAQRLSGLAEPVFYRTRSFPCSYLPDREESRVLTVLTDDLAEQGLYDILQRFGFRRSQRYLYRPSCQNCQACVPVRIRTADFQPSRTQRKLRTRNSDLIGHWGISRVDDSLYRLFSRYEAARHPDSDMARMSEIDLAAMIEDSPIDTRLFTLRDSAGETEAACLIDVSDDGFSAVYSFYNPEDPRRSLGTELILRLIDEAKLNTLPYLYLGYWVDACQKMSYKASFNQVERLTGTRWTSMG